MQTQLIETVTAELEPLLAQLPNRPAGPHPEDTPRVTPEEVATLAPAELARFIDHTLLKPEAPAADHDRHCDEAMQYGFASVCVQPWRLARCVDRLKGSPVRACTVVGFPMGVNTVAIKAREAAELVALGADELDMVINLGRLRDGDDKGVVADVAAVAKAAEGKLVKVILETGGLEEAEIVRACLLCRHAGAHTVKTSTGYMFGGATVEAVSLMRATLGDTMGVKAAGGVKDAEAARTMLAAGANRIGASAGIAICSGGAGGEGY